MKGFKIKDGFTKIVDETQLEQLPDGFYLCQRETGEIHRFIKKGIAWYDHLVRWTDGHMAKHCIAFRHVSDAAPVADDGFEKKTMFQARQLQWWAAEFPVPTVVAEMARHIKECHAEIDRQAAELAQLKAAREWQPVTVEALEAAPDGTYEMVHRDSSELCVANKCSEKWWVIARRSPVGVSDSSSIYSHFRLITRAEDFTPPERKIKLEGEYTRAELEKILKEKE